MWRPEVCFGWLPQLLLCLLLLFCFSFLLGWLLGWLFCCLAVLGEGGLCWRKDLLLNLNILPGWLTGPWASGIFLYLSLHLPLCTGVTDVCCCTSVHYVDSGDLNPGLLHLHCRHFTNWAASLALFSVSFACVVSCLITALVGSFAQYCIADCHQHEYLQPWLNLYSSILWILPNSFIQALFGWA